MDAITFLQSLPPAKALIYFLGALAFIPTVSMILWVLWVEVEKHKEILLLVIVSLAFLSIPVYKLVAA